MHASSLLASPVNTGPGMQAACQCATTCACVIAKEMLAQGLWRRWGLRLQCSFSSYIPWLGAAMSLAGLWRL
jgi:hypothetical protein